MKVLPSDPASAALRGRELVSAEIDPEIAAFERWFRDTTHGGTPLTPMEREMLKAYLYQKLTGGF